MTAAVNHGPGVDVGYSGVGMVGQHPESVEKIMGDIVSFRQKRKRAVRQKEAARAAENRLIHGRSKSERALDEARAKELERKLDGHRIELEDGR